MRIERLDAGQVGRLGGSAAVAAHLRSLVPAGDSVGTGGPRDLGEGARRGRRCRQRLHRRFDTSGNDPRPLRVTPEELDEAIKLLPLELVAGLQVAIANVAEVAQAGVSEDVAVELPQGAADRAARGARRLGGRVRPGRAGALPEHGRDGV